MKANTALSLVLLAVATFARSRPRIVVACGAVVGAIAALTLLEYIAGRSFGIDELVFNDTKTALQAFPGRSAATTATYLLLLGIAVILLALRRTRTAHALAAIAFLGSFVSLLGYVFGVERLYAVSTYTSMALHTAISLGVVALAVLASSPQRGLTRLAVDPGAGGILVRRAVPVIWIGLILIGWLRLLGEHDQLYGTEFGLTIMVISSLVLVTGFIALVARRLSAIDERRLIAERELRELNVELEAKVTERTAELAETEARYRTVIEVSPNYLTIAQDERYVFANDEALRVLEVDRPEDLIGRNIWDFVAPESLEMSRSRVDAAAGGRTVPMQEITMIGARGTRTVLLATTKPFMYQGRPALLSGGNDVTRLRAAERAQSLLAAIVDSAHLAVYSKDRNTVITSWNAGAESLYGYTPDEAIGRSVGMLIPPDRAGEELRILDGILAGDEVDHYETTRVRKDGRIVPVWLAVAPVKDATGNVIGASTVARDVSTEHEMERARRENEELFRALVESSPDALFVVDEEGCITLANDQAARLLRCEPGELVGRSVDTLVPTLRREHHAAHRASFMNDLRRRAMGAGQELTALRNDGTVVPVDISLSYVTMSTGTLVFASMRDATAQRHALEAEREVARKMTELNDLKNDFVGIVAHDLKSPITVIQGFADMLLEDWNASDAAAQRDGLERIGDNARRLIRLVDDVLQVARIESGDFSFNIAPFDLARLVGRTAAEVRALHPERTIDVIAEPDVPFVTGDEERTWRVITNLVTNALKFSDATEPIEVGVCRTGASVEVAVRDRGYGIRPDDLSKLFGRFARLQQPEGRRVTGTGLGLYICKQLVEGQSGSIWADSTVGEGSTFHFTLPAETTP